MYLKGTEDEVYSAVVSPVMCCVMMAHMWPKPCSDKK